jgi:hypothetical protein
METAMQKPSSDSCPLTAEAADRADLAAPARDADPAGGIVLTGRNRACSRARVLAGMVLTSGVVAALNVLDTTSSMTNGHLS